MSHTFAVLNDSDRANKVFNLNVTEGAYTAVLHAEVDVLDGVAEFFLDDRPYGVVDEKLLNLVDAEDRWETVLDYVLTEDENVSDASVEALRKEIDRAVREFAANQRLL